jgi:hypothetical protein
MAPQVREERAVRDFHIDVPEEELVDLRRRILATRWPERETGKRCFAYVVKLWALYEACTKGSGASLGLAETQLARAGEPN